MARSEKTVCLFQISSFFFNPQIVSIISVLLYLLVAHQYDYVAYLKTESITFLIISEILLKKTKEKAPYITYFLQ